MSSSIEKRVFLVGCSRSGTTLTQVLITRHPRIYSFPESSFFIHGVGRRRRVLASLGISTGRERRAIEKFVRVIQREDLLEGIPPRFYLFSSAVNHYVRILDTLSMENNKDVWLEKSPMHVHYISLIAKYVPNAFFVHLIRDGRDVVASIYDRSLKFPERFAHQRDLSFGIQRWNNAIKESLRYLGCATHSFVLYDDVVAQSSLILGFICREIGIEFDATMLEDFRSASKGVILPEWNWVKGAMNPPKTQPDKFSTLFSAQQQAQITEELDLQSYERIKEYIDSSYKALNNPAIGAL